MKNDIKHIHRLIDLYFSGETTLEQERELRRLLISHTGPRDEAIDQALAVMSFAAVAPRHETRSKRAAMPRMLRITTIAASIAVVATIAVSVIRSKTTPPIDGCVAYVGSETIHDRDHIISLVASDWADISDASAEIDNNISGDLSTIIENMDL